MTQSNSPRLPLVAILSMLLKSTDNVVKAAVGTLADSSGEVVAWGRNVEGQTIVPAGSFIAVAGGLTHSLALRADGTLAGWGDNTGGATTVPAGTFTTVAAGSHYSLALRSDGTPQRTHRIVDVSLQQPRDERGGQNHTQECRRIGSRHN
jgi:alpha-tubulin suppressor-like RCC1 family protein